MTTVVVAEQGRNPGCLIQLLWFVFVGWWAGQIWIALSWLLMLTVLGIPLAIMMLNALPKVIALRSKSHQMTVTVADPEGRAGGVVVISRAAQPQINIFVRIVYFILVGWWLSALWMELAYFLCAILIGMPIGFWMFDRVPALVSLRR